ncbi:hypothetical protein [Photobacterium rosenbergii]|uniref:hypothetical protein n=1 Tax=Photobacterium rosenbergii TaxID=294936 RepID=UPI001C998C0A|nr:hypothetical protein [Photobacterium rosenbergii]MBY5944938.1 hypothetical protein [Photobacterium rosenbergii]
MTRMIVKSLMVAALVTATMPVLGAVDWSTPMSCSQKERYVAQLGQSNLNGLTLVPVAGHPKFTSFDFSPYVNSSMLVSNQANFPMIDATEDDEGTVRFYTKSHRKHKLSRGGMMFKFERVDDEHYDLTLWTEQGPAIKKDDGSKVLPFKKPKKFTSDGQPLRLRITEESIRERAKHSCVAS